MYHCNLYNSQQYFSNLSNLCCTSHKLINSLKNQLWIQCYLGTALNNHLLLHNKRGLGYMISIALDSFDCKSYISSHNMSKQYLYLPLNPPGMLSRRCYHTCSILKESCRLCKQLQNFSNLNSWSCIKSMFLNHSSKILKGKKHSKTLNRSISDLCFKGMMYNN